MLNECYTHYKGAVYHSTLAVHLRKTLNVLTYFGSN